MKGSLQNWLDNLEDTLFDNAIIRLQQALEALHNASDDNNAEDYQTEAADYFVNALEALLCYVAYQKAPLLLFRNLPVEWRLNLATSGRKAEISVSRYEELKMISGHYPYISLNDGIQLLEHLYPYKKQFLWPYWQLVVDYRNREATLPYRRNTELSSKLGYLALEVISFLTDDGVLPMNSYKLSSRDRKFLQQYAENRVQRVEEALCNPEEWQTPIPNYPADKWSSYSHKCPSCDQMAQLKGYTVISREVKEDMLTFYACALNCQHCALRLFDTTELSIAGCTNVFDLSHLLAEWMKDKEMVNEIAAFAK